MLFRSRDPSMLPDISILFFSRNSLAAKRIASRLLWHVIGLSGVHNLVLPSGALKIPLYGPLDTFAAPYSKRLRSSHSTTQPAVSIVATGSTLSRYGSYAAMRRPSNIMRAARSRVHNCPKNLKSSCFSCALYWYAMSSRP